jgi:hypothetical protein
MLRARGAGHVLEQPGDGLGAVAAEPGLDLAGPVTGLATVLLSQVRLLADRREQVSQVDGLLGAEQRFHRALPPPHHRLHGQLRGAWGVADDVGDQFSDDLLELADETSGISGASS